MNPWEAKATMRRKLAALPIDIKLKFVVLMQRRANEIRRSAGRPEKAEWPYKAFGMVEGEEQKVWEQAVQFWEVQGDPLL